MEVILDNKSSRDFGLIVEQKPTIPIIKQRINNIQIDGRDGTLTEKLGYGNKSIGVKFILLEEDSLSRQIRELTGWLINSKTLKFSDDLEVFYKIKSVDVSNIDRQLRFLGNFSVSFEVEPFAYLDSEIITIDKSTTIYNSGTYFSQPYFRIYGNNDINISVNNKTITLKNIQDYIELDTEIMDCYKGTTPLNDKMIGEFPFFYVGENTINWIGNVSKIDIRGRWRCL